MERSRFVLITLLASSLAGCAHTQSTPTRPTMAPHGALVEGGPTALAVLDFLNDHGHEYDLLDEDVALDARAARGLVARRSGDDGQLGTADDRIFETLADVDDVAWVGPVSMQKIAGFAAARGYVSKGHRTVGSFEGVSFTFAEADATLELVNFSSVRTLDHQLQLDQRAVSSIVHARPILTLGQLAELYYVGPAALTLLKAHAATSGVASR